MIKTTKQTGKRKRKQTETGVPTGHSTKQEKLLLIQIY